MAITTLLTRKGLQKTITIMMVLAVGLIIFGVWSISNHSPNASIAIITGAILLLFALINKWWLKFSRKPS